MKPTPPPGVPAVADTGPAARGRVCVAEVTAETDAGLPPEIPWHLAGAAGDVQLQLRTTLRRVAMGAGLARRDGLVETVRALPGIPPVVTSPAGGTFVIGGEAWLGLCAIGVPRPDGPLPLDWMMAALTGWFGAALAGYGVTVATGRVDGAWCPGFSDVSVAGRKLAGLGFRVSREWVVMRGMLAVRPMDAADLAVLTACHRLIDVEVVPGTATSLAEVSGDPSLTVAGVIERVRGIVSGPQAAG